MDVGDKYTVGTVGDTKVKYKAVVKRWSVKSWPLRFVLVGRLCML